MIYETLAPFYDALFYDKEATKQWTDFTLKHCGGKDILELASGGGDVAAQLMEKGIEILASDISKEMKNIAKKKYPHLSFEVMDMKNIMTEKKWDTVIFYCDSVNYLRNCEELIQFLQGIKAVLKSNGVLLFDIHSADRLDEFEEVYIEEGVVLDTPYQWTIHKEEHNLYHHFAFYKEDGITEENHIQYIFSIEEIISCLKEVGFSWEIKTDFIHDGIHAGEKYFLICKGDTE